MEKRSIIILTVVLILAGILIFIGFAFYKYFKSPEKTLGIGANIESVLLSEDGKTAYIKLSWESNKNITKIKFTLTDKKGKEYFYETSEGAQEISVPYRRGFWDWLFGRQFVGSYNYQINSESAGLSDFNNINQVDVLFEYQTEAGESVDSPVLDTGTPTANTTTPTSSGSSRSSGNDDSSTTTPPTTPTCTNDTSCTFVGSFCDNNIPYNCSLGSDGCLDRVNGSECGSGFYCSGGCVEAPSQNTFYVSVTGAGSKNGSSQSNAMNLSQAQAYANNHTNDEITFLLGGGNYGEISQHTDSWNGTAWNIKGLDRYGGDMNEKLPPDIKWITFKADEGQKPVFTRIHIGNVHGPWLVKYIFDGIIINGTETDIPMPIQLEEVVGFKIFNSILIGSFEYYRSSTSAVIWTDESNEIKIINNSLSKSRYGIYQTGGFNNIDIIGNKITDIGEDPLRLGGNNILFKNNEIYSLGQNVPATAHQDYIHFTNSENLTFRNNKIYAHRGGCHFNGGHTFKNFVFEGNIIYDMNGYEFTPNNVINGIFRNNTIIGIGDMPGVTFEEGCSNISVSNNLFLTIYSGNDSSISYHDKNIYVSILDWSPGEREANSYGYQAIGPTKYGIIQKLINETLTNYPEYCRGIIYNRRNFSNLVLGNSTDGYVTVSKPGETFEEFNLRQHLDYIEFMKVPSLLCNSWSDPCKLRLKKIESGILTLDQKYDSFVLNPAETFNGTLKYSASTKNKIYVADTFGHSVAETYHVGDIIDYNYQEIPHEITAVLSDENGTYIQFTPDLPEKAEAVRWFCNWGQNPSSIKRDFRARMDGPACNGSINPLGIAVGALPCVCTNNSQCEEVFGSNYVCENEKCVETPQQNTFYVSVTGAGSHDGSLGNEMNLSEAKSYANINSDELITFLLESGNYGDVVFSSSISRTSWAIWKANGDVNLSSIKISNSLKRDGYLKFENLKINKEDYRVNLIEIEKINYLIFEKVSIFNDKLEYHVPQDRAVIISDSDNILFDGCSLKGAFNSTTSTEKGIYSYDESNNQNITIKNCDIQGYRKSIYMNGQNWIVENNTIHNIPEDGIVIGYCTNCTISNNKIYDLMPFNVERCLDSDSGTDCAHSDCLQANYVPSHNITIRNNLCYNGFTHGWWINPLGATNYVIENNMVFNATHVGNGGADTATVCNINGIIFRNNLIEGKAKTHDGGLGCNRATTYWRNFSYNIIRVLEVNSSGGVEYEDYNIFGYVLPWGGWKNPLGSHSKNFAGDYNSFYDIFVNASNNDFTPKWNSIACPGGNSNLSAGQYIGALPCVCTNDQQCADLGLGDCDEASGKCSGLPSLSPFTQLLNFIKSLLTTKTGNAILAGKTINGNVIGNAVNETGNGNYKSSYIVLSIFVVIILIITVMIVKIKKNKKIKLKIKKKKR